MKKAKPITISELNEIKAKEPLKKFKDEKGFIVVGKDQFIIGNDDDGYTLAPVKDEWLNDDGENFFTLNGVPGIVVEDEKGNWGYFMNDNPQQWREQFGKFEKP